MPTNMPTVSINITLVWQILNFAILMVVFYVFLFKPLGKTLEKRKKDIADNLNEINENKKITLEEKEKSQKELKEARQKSQELINTALKKGEEVRDNVLKEAHTAREKMMKAAESDIEKMKIQAKRELRNEMTGIAIKLAEKMIGKSMDGDLENNLLDQFIDGVGDQQ